jgi:hypothetical protein
VLNHTQIYLATVARSMYNHFNMARSIERLTTLDIQQATAGTLLCDGNGLYFRASGLGRGSWEFRYSLYGRE